MTNGYAYLQGLGRSLLEDMQSSLGNAEATTPQGTEPPHDSTPPHDSPTQEGGSPRSALQEPTTGVLQHGGRNEHGQEEQQQKVAAAAEQHQFEKSPHPAVTSLQHTQAVADRGAHKPCR